MAVLTSNVQRGPTSLLPARVPNHANKRADAHHAPKECSECEHPIASCVYVNSSCLATCAMHALRRLSYAGRGDVVFGDANAHNGAGTAPLRASQSTRKREVQPSKPLATIVRSQLPTPPLLHHKPFTNKDTIMIASRRHSSVHNNTANSPCLG